jgi:hypothetical protein
MLMFGVKPKCVATYPDCVKAFGQRNTQFIVPSADESLKTDLIFLEIPIASGNYLYASGSDISVKIRNVPV